MCGSSQHVLEPQGCWHCYTSGSDYGNAQNLLLAGTVCGTHYALLTLCDNKSSDKRGQELV